MFMGLFGTKKHETVLVMELNSGSVSGAFILKEKGQAPLVIDTAKREFSRREIMDPARLKDDLFTALDSVSLQLQKNFHGRPSRIFIILTAPWSHAEIRAVKYESNHDFKFTEKMGMKMVSAEMKKLNHEDPERTLVDHRTVEVLLNGYPTDAPNGKLCRVAELKCLFSFAPLELLSAVRDRLHRTWRASVIFSSVISSDFMVLRDISPGNSEMMIINVGAEMTEVSVLGHGHISGTATFPIGERTFIRASAGILGKSSLETDSLFSLLISRSLESTQMEKAQSAFLSAREKWQAGLKSVLMELCPGRSLPSQIFFSSNSIVTEYFTSDMKSKSFPEFTTAYSGMSAIMIDMNRLHGFVHWKDGAVRDPRIAMNAIFINRS